MVLWGTGTPLREFLWSEDMADASVHVLLNVDFADLKPREGEIRNCHINVGTGSELTIKELSQLVARATGFTGTIEFDASKPDGTPRKLIDVDKLHQLGWTHRIDIDEGVSLLYQWYLGN